MTYSAIQHPDGRWGIYYGLELLATIGCQKSCHDIVLNLNYCNRKNQNKKAPLIHNE